MTPTQSSLSLLLPVYKMGSQLSNIPSHNHHPSSFLVIIPMIGCHSFFSYFSSRPFTLLFLLIPALNIFTLPGNPSLFRALHSLRGPTHHPSIFIHIVSQVISRGRCRHGFQIRILNKLSSFCEIHHTSLDTSHILSSSFISEVASTWPCDHFFPLLDFIASSVRTVSVDALDSITGECSVFESLFAMPIIDSQASSHEILLQLLCECVSECMQSSLALPLLLRHQSSIHKLLVASLSSSRTV